MFTLTFRGEPEAEPVVMWAEVPWDSALYGFPVVEVRTAAGRKPDGLREALRAVLEGLDRRARSLVFAKLGAGEIGAAEVFCEAGFRPVETQLEAFVALPRLRPLAGKIGAAWRLEEARPGDRAALERIARQAFRTDRLHLDPSLPPEVADERYAAWVGRALDEGEPVFLLKDREGEPLGFFHVRWTSKESVELSLAAVDPERWRPGAGAVLFERVLLACRERGAAAASARIAVLNTEVMSLYAALGFSFRHPRVTLHRVRTGPGTPVG